MGVNAMSGDNRGQYISKNQDREKRWENLVLLAGVAAAVNAHQSIAQKNTTGI